MVPLTGQNTVNDMVDRINEVSQEIQDIAVVNANAVLGPASASADQIMAFSDTTGKKAKAANISPFAYSILDDADDATARETLGLKSAAVLDAATAATPNTAVQRDVSGNITGVGITATSGFVGNGSQITSLNVGNVASGTLAVANGGTGTTTSTGTGSVVRSASPTFTGAPLSTTASADTNTTQIATTAYVIGQASSTAPLMDGVAAVGTSLRYARADHVHPSDTTKVNTSLLGAANGVATLDSAGKVPTSQLPAYVDDVLEYANLASFPATGETGKIYVALDTNKTYRWSGSAYIYITSGAVDSVAGKTGVVTLVKGDVGLGNVDNTSDVNKPVSTAQQNALNLKANLASPALTGTPTAPTAAVGTNTTQLATTAFVQAEIANDAPSKTGDGASGSWGISVTGNAATATKLQTARTINGVAFDGTSNIVAAFGWGHTGSLQAIGNVDTNHPPGLYYYNSDTGGSSGGPETYGSILVTSMHGPAASFSGWASQTFFGTSGRVFTRTSTAANPTTAANWTPWRDIFDANNLSRGIVPDARLSGTYTGVNITGNAATATKLATARTIALTGDVTGSGSFDGTGNLTITATVGDDSHSHIIGNVTGLQTALDAKAPLSSPALTGVPTAPTNSSPGTSNTQVATTAFVQSVVNGYLSKSVTGGTVVLTADEAANAVINLSGTLTSALIIEIPVTANRIYSISNSTTGAFTTSVRSGPTGAAVLVAQGKRNLIYTNTAGAYDAINDFDSIALSGVPTAPTAAVGNSSTQVATTAFVNAEIANDAPTKTGGGASGSWGISVTGNAATATKLQTARTIGGVSFDGTADINLPGVNAAGNQSTTGNAATATKLATARTINGVSFDGTANITVSDATKLSLGGGTLTGFLATKVTGHAVGASGGDGSLSVRGDANSAAVLSFHRTGTYGINLGLDTDNVFRLGGWTNGTSVYRFQVDGSGNFTANGNVTAYSDIRLKKDIRVIPDALAKVEQLSGVTYERIDSGERQTGLIAQEVQKVLPEAVMQSDEYLSVAYGNMVGLLVEAIKELRAEVADLRSQVGGV